MIIFPRLFGPSRQDREDARQQQLLTICLLYTSPSPRDA